MGSNQLATTLQQHKSLKMFRHVFGDAYIAVYIRQNSPNCVLKTHQFNYTDNTSMKLILKKA